MVQESSAPVATPRGKVSAWRVRDIHAGSLTDLTMVAAVATILLTRAFLAATGYPKVGGTSLHIAHMLWGGLIMALAFGLLLQAADRLWKPLAALLFGIGFGLFIDEIGKFVTHDHDYFFAPSFALMYVVFLLFFLLSRLISRLDKRPPQEQTYFAALAVAHLAVNSLPDSERRAALEHLADGPDDDVAHALRELLRQPARTAGRRFSVAEWGVRVDRLSQSFLRLRAVQVTVVGVFLLGAVVTGVMAVISAVDERPHSVSDWVSVGWPVIAGTLIVIGLIAWLRGARGRGLHMFYLASLVSLFIGQVYTFAEMQLWGVANLLGNLILLGVLRLAMHAAEQDRP